MIALPSGVRVYIACGVTDMRKGMVGCKRRLTAIFHFGLSVVRG